MLSRSQSLSLVAILACMFAMAFIAVERTATAQDTPSWNKNIPKETPAPTPKRVTPRPRPRPAQPKPRPAPAAQLLSVQFRIFRVTDTNTQIEVNPLTVFNKGDRLRIAMKANQDVYLYVIHQKVPDQSGRLFFPDSRLNNGQNFLAKNSEVLVPSGCVGPVPPQECSYTVDGTAGQEAFTMIFTRNPSINLLENESGGINSEIKPQTLVAYATSSNQQLDTTGRADSTFGRLVRNVNPKANNQIIVRYVLNKRG
jgi:hypothetical protein